MLLIISGIALIELPRHHPYLHEFVTKTMNEIIHRGPSFSTNKKSIVNLLILRCREGNEVWYN